LFSEKRIAIALLVLLFAMQIVVLIARSDRQPHLDEVEYLHAAWLMANGGQIFTTFFEHHSPLLFAAIAPLAPQTERADAQPYAENARWVAGLAGLLALAAFASVVASRAGAIASVIAVTAFFAAGPVWLRVIADVRAEPFALAFFWCGVALALLPQQRIALYAGLGIGFIAIAGLWTPKWPLCSAVIALWAIARVRNGRIVAILIAATVTAIGLAVVHALAPLDAVRFFTFEFSAAAYRRLQEAPAAFLLQRPFYEAPSRLGLPVASIAALLVLLAAKFDRNRRGPLLFVVLFAAAVLEIRFVHPYPVVWWHNYGLWSLSAAAILGAVPRAILALVQRARVSPRVQQWTAFALAIGAIVWLLPNVLVQLAIAPDDTGPFWRAQRALVARLHPGDTIWITPARHPITVRDAHYYWFGFEGSTLQVVADLAKTARGAGYLPPLENLPLCAALHSETRLRFASVPDAGTAAQSERSCFAALQATGRVRNTGSPRVFEILPIADHRLESARITKGTSQ
jgi:hypothetical protein